jgi:sporulation protein YlmC with PRC-barrel domain
MLRKTLMAGAAATLLVGLPVATIPAFAQNATPSATAPAADSVKADKLIGRSVVNAQDETVGDINSVYLNKDGKVDSVIVGVGGFLGVGEREVALNWSDLKISDNGNKIMVNATKDQLKAMPEYKYTNKSYRGSVFSDKGVTTPPMTTHADNGTMPGRNTTNGGMATNSGPAATTPPATTTPGAMTPSNRADMNKPMPNTADNGKTKHNPAMNAAGNMSANAIIGADVRNNANETIGKVQDIFVSRDGAIKGVIVGVGGFLGIGEHNVMLSWDQVQLRQNQDRDGVVITTDATKDSLKAMPEYSKM